MDTFRHRTRAKHALGGLLKPLFRQFQDEARISGLQAAGRITIIPDLVRMQALTSVQHTNIDLSRWSTCLSLHNDLPSTKLIQCRVGQLAS
jgi:hypothetical protein